MGEQLHELAARAWAICQEARPTCVAWIEGMEGSISDAGYWANDDANEVDEPFARAAIVAQGMACICAWSDGLALASLRNIYRDAGPLAERVLRAIIAVAPSVPTPTPKPAEV